MKHFIVGINLVGFRKFELSGLHCSSVDFASATFKRQKVGLNEDEITTKRQMTVKCTFGLFT